MSERHTILILEDNPENAAALRDLVGAMDMEARIVTTLEELRALLATGFKPCGALLDMQVPYATGARPHEKAGESAIAMVQARWQGEARVAIVVVTAFRSDPEYVWAMAELKVDEFCAKTNIVALPDKLTRALEKAGRRAHRECVGKDCAGQAGDMRAVGTTPPKAPSAPPESAVSAEPARAKDERVRVAMRGEPAARGRTTICICGETRTKTHQAKSTAHETTLSAEAAIGGRADSTAPLSPVVPIVAALAGEPTSPSTPESATAAAATGTDAGSTSSAASSAAGTGRFVAPPPPPDSAFVPPAGFVPDNAMDFRGVLPRSAELVVLPAAVQDLMKFTDYAAVMGSKAPSLAQAILAFEVTNQWSSARTQADAWDAYARTQEGICWTMLRALMAQLAPTYQVAVASDPTMASSLPNLTTLLGAKKTIAHKGVSTKKANAKAKAEGKPETHGKVGKRATKAAEKAALAEKLAAESAGGQAATQAGAVPQPVVVPQVAPVVQASGAQAAPVGTTAGTNGVVNGGAH